MFDAWYMGNTAETEVLYRQDYDPNNVVTSADITNPGGHDVTVLFHPWHGGGRAYDVLTTRLARNGQAVLNLVYDDQILTHDAPQVLESFTTAARTSADILDDMATVGRYQKIHLFAASLGTPVLCMTASLHNGFDSATLVTPGANLADCMWNGARTQRVRREFEIQGADFRSVDDAWQPIAPINHIAALTDKELTVLISATDKIIPARSQQQYVDALRASGVDPTVLISEWGHYATIGRYCMVG